MPVELTNEQYGTVWRALVKIAHARFGQNNQRISREAAMTIAREACDEIGWKYDTNAMKAFGDQ